jgi:hypothetical protein
LGATQPVWKRFGVFQNKIAAKLKERAEKEAYEKALKTETLSQEQLLANAISLEDLEKQLQESQTDGSQNQEKPSEPKKKTAPVFNWTFPKVNLDLVKVPQWQVKPFFLSLTGHKAIRWVLAAVFLAIGGYIAKATLAPLLARTPVNTSNTQLLPDMVVSMPNGSFLRYEMVPFEIKLTSKEVFNFSDVHAEVVIYNNGDPVTTVGGKDKWILKKDEKNHRLYGNWPIPYNPKPGTYVAELSVVSPEWKGPKVLRSAFTIPPLKPQGLYPGYATLTMEGGKQLINGAVPAIDGSDSVNPQNAIIWEQTVIVF